jgi:hypothetical protein
MAIRLRTVDNLAKEVGGRKSALALLAEKGVRVINDTFDDNRLEAAYAEPRWLHTRRQDWSLSHHSGLGAVKYLLDPLKVNIVQHECRGSQWLMLEGPSRRRQFVKMYYTGKMTGTANPAANFQIRNFLREDAPNFYVLMSFEGPHIWSVPSRKLAEMWRLLKRTRKPSESDEGFSVPAGLNEHKFGALNVYLHADDRRFKLDALKRVGLV